MTDETPKSPPTAPTKQNKSLDAATLFSALALLVSFAALFVSFYETSILETQNNAAVWPYSELYTTYDSQGFAIEIANRGIGPARITEVVLKVDGNNPKDPLDFAAMVAGEDPGFGYDIIKANTISDGVLSAGGTLTLFAVPWTPRTRDVINSFDIKRLEANICYCSIFGECWRADINQTPRRDTTCQKPKD